MTCHPDPTVLVKLASVLARHTSNQKEIGCRLTGGDTLQSLLQNLDDRFPGIKILICTNDIDIVDHINVYVNGDNVRYLQGMMTPLSQGDVVNIIPAAAAG
jgi:molybdopterin synthase sulfur carrier subunit